MNSKYTVPAVVLGMSVNGLGVVRGLGSCGIKVYAFDTDGTNPAMKTRFAECQVCPDMRKDPAGFEKFLLDFARKLGKPCVLLPTSDNANEFINGRREVLAPFFKFIMPDKPLMDKLMDKRGQYELALAHGVLVPETFSPKDLSEINTLAPKLNYPVIVKGLTTGGWRAKFGDQKAVIIENARKLKDVYAAITTDNIETIIQEIIPGDDTRHYKICAYLDKNGEVLLQFTLQKLMQYPCDFGIGSSVKSINVPEIREVGLRFFKEIGYRGVGSIEFKKDARDNRFKMIEINPRLWAQNSLPNSCGQNFALTAYLDILGEKVEPKAEFTEGVKWIAFNEDRSSFIQYYRQGRKTWGEWFKSILTGKRVWAIWTMDDPLPFLSAINFGFAPVYKIWKRLIKQ